MSLLRLDGLPPGTDEKEVEMTHVHASITTSLDGYVVGPNDGPGKGLGEGGERLRVAAASGSERGRVEHRSAAERWSDDPVQVAPSKLLPL
jgi:hypothetical protein